MLDFVVTGCGRSGTKYTAELLTAAGVRCTHEKVFGPHAMRDGIPTRNFQQGPGEASWIAAGILHELIRPIHKLIVIHQVRNPVKVVRSMMGINSFTRKSNYRDFIFRTLPQLDQEDDVLTKCMAFWCLWNGLARGLVDNYDLRIIKVEELAGPEVFGHLLKKIGNITSTARAAEILARIPTNTHTRDQDESVSWGSMPEGHWKDRMHESALKYRYTEEDLHEA